LVEILAIMKETVGTRATILAALIKKKENIQVSSGKFAIVARMGKRLQLFVGYYGFNQLYSSLL